jgi:hypothetical protein
MRLDRRDLLTAACALAAPGSASEEPAPGFDVRRTDLAVTVAAPGARPLFRYVRARLPAGETVPAVEGGGYIHPIHTPSGDVVTDLAPADHPHHRGVFCGWVQVEGEAAGDWWGWGALAPKVGRRVESVEAEVLERGERAVTLRFVNLWMAEATPVMRERLVLTARAENTAHVLDFEFKFVTPTRHAVTIARNPFGGFCYRARPRGTLEVTGPDGRLNLPDAVFNRPETNWRASNWYDLTYRRRDGGISGVAVMDHPVNPFSTWHVVRPIHMANPCIAAEGPVGIAFGEPLYLAGLYDEFSNG